MSRPAAARLMLVLAGLYDGVLGLGFLTAAPAIFSMCGVPAPNHWAYVHFGSALLLIFALMFFAAAFQPVGNRHLIAYGMLLKIAYVGTVLVHWGDAPGVFKLFMPLDVVWFTLLGWIFIALRPGAGKSDAAVSG